MGKRCGRDDIGWMMGWRERMWGLESGVLGGYGNLAQGRLPGTHEGDSKEIF